MKAATVLLAIATLFFLQTDVPGQDSAEAPRVEKHSMRPHLRVSIKDANRGLSFELHPDGKVELKVREENEKTGSTEDRIYKADSLEKFKTRYPDAARKYSIDRFVPRLEGDELDRRPWEEWKNGFGEAWPWDPGRDVPRWFREWWTPFERFRNRRNTTSQPSFGLRVGAVGDTLSSHLGLKEGEGALVVEVVDGTPAQEAGFKKHDVIVKLDGRVITDRGEFRKRLREQAGQGFELEVIRQGKRETITIKAAGQ